MHRWLAFVVGVLALLALACQPTPTPARLPDAPAPAASARVALDAVPLPVKPVTVAIVSPNEAFSLAWVGRDSGIFLKALDGTVRDFAQTSPLVGALNQRLMFRRIHVLEQYRDLVQESVGRS